MTRPIDVVELYAVKPVQGYDDWVVYEKSPIPGMADSPILSRPTKGQALDDAKEFLDLHCGGSFFKRQRASVG